MRPWFAAKHVLKICGIGVTIVTIDMEPTSNSQWSDAAEYDSYMPEEEVHQNKPLTQAHTRPQPF